MIDLLEAKQAAYDLLGISDEVLVDYATKDFRRTRFQVPSWTITDNQTAAFNMDECAPDMEDANGSKLFDDAICYCDWDDEEDRPNEDRVNHQALGTSSCGRFIVYYEHFLSDWDDSHTLFLEVAASNNKEAVEHLRRQFESYKNNLKDIDQDCIYGVDDMIKVAA